MLLKMEPIIDKMILVLYNAISVSTAAKSFPALLLTLPVIKRKEGLILN